MLPVCGKYVLWKKCFVKNMTSTTRVSTQWQIVRHDKWLLSCLTWVPLLLALSIWWIFSQGIARDLPIGIVDLEHSQLSRTLSREFDATSSLAIHDNYADINQAKTALISGDIYGYVIIPSNFTKDIYRGTPPQVSVFYNSQYILIGKLVNSAILQAQGTFNAQLDVVKSLTSGNTTAKSALGKAVAVRTQITPLFNKNTNYAQFLVSAVVPALWQIVIVVGTIMILAANHRTYGTQKWLKSSPMTTVVKTLAAYIPVFLIQGIGFLLWFYKGFEWPMNGGFSVLIFAQLATVIVCMIMGSLFFFLTLDPARAMSFAGAFTAPSFAFMGITFPVTDMNPFAQAWRSLLPISHYIETQVSQSSYGVTQIESLVHLIPMIGYLFPLLLTALLINKHLKQSEKV